MNTLFLTTNMTSMENSEFVLTIFGVLAQEKSANAFNRIKFDKRVNAEQGRMPNLVLGYNKILGDSFKLASMKKKRIPSAVSISSMCSRATVS